MFLSEGRMKDPLMTGLTVSLYFARITPSFNKSLLRRVALDTTTSLVAQRTGHQCHNSVLQFRFSCITKENSDPVVVVTCKNPTDRVHN